MGVMMRRVVPLPFPASPALRSPEELGAYIRAARTQSNLTLETAALLIGISKQTLLNIEKNPGSVSFSYVLRAAHELGVSLFAIPAQKQEIAQRAMSSVLG